MRLSLYGSLLFVCLALMPASAQNTIQFMARNVMTKSDQVAPQTWLFVTHRDSGSFVGFNGFAYVMEGWGEGVGGICFYPSSMFCFTLYGGMETVEDWWRVAVDGLFSVGKFSLYGWYEYGASGKDGDFLFFIPAYKPIDWLKVEGKVSRFGPTWKAGPGMAGYIPKTPLSIEPFVLYDFQAKEVSVELSAYLDF